MNILFIDWENFKNRIQEVLRKENVTNKIDWHEYNFRGLFNQVLQKVQTDRRIFYSAKLMVSPRTAKKSKELIERQRLLKTRVESQGCEFIFAGRVRETTNKKGNVNFIEKGVDVRIAVDMVKMGFKNELETIILASSDSDLQPAIKAVREVEELKKKPIEIIYLGFEMGHNRGLSYTTDRTILIRNSEVLEFLPQKLNI